MFKILHIYMCERFVYNYIPCIRPTSIRLSNNATKNQSEKARIDGICTPSLFMDVHSTNRPRALAQRRTKMLKTHPRQKRRKQKWIDIDLYMDAFSEEI